MRDQTYIGWPCQRAKMCHCVRWMELDVFAENPNLVAIYSVVSTSSQTENMVRQLGGRLVFRYEPVYVLYGAEVHQTSLQPRVVGIHTSLGEVDHTRNRFILVVFLLQACAVEWIVRANRGLER